MRTIYHISMQEFAKAYLGPTADFPIVPTVLWGVC